MRKTSEHIDTRKNKSDKYTEGKRKGKKAMYGYMCKVINDFFSFPSPVLGGFFLFQPETPGSGSLKLCSLKLELCYWQRKMKVKRSTH